ncbi:MAG: V4R domain-containing protein [Candidatus Helarchaeota archaeon]
MTDLLERVKPHTFKEFMLFKGIIEGAIEGVRQRYAIMDKMHWNTFYSSMRENLLGDAANAILKKIGEDFGKKIFALAQEKYGADAKTAFLFVLQNLEKLGWGAFWNVDINLEGKEISLELHNTNEAYTSNTPSCYHVEGILRGIAKALLGKDIVVRELECTAKGDKVCKFIIGDRSVVPQLYDEETIENLRKVLQELRGTIKSSVELLATTDGRPIISNLSEDLDPVLWTTIVSFILAGAEKASELIENADLKELIVNGEKGTIIASLVNESTILAVVIGSDTSPGLAGLALKKAKDKIQALI